MLATRMRQAAAGVVAVGPVFGTIEAQTLTTNTGSWTGLTLRDRINASELTAPSGTPTKMRVTIEAASDTGFVMASMYVDHQGASNDYDFISTPVEITFDGGSGYTASAGEAKLSDEVSFAWDKSSDLVLSCYFTTAAKTRRTGSLGSGHHSYFKSGDDASNPNPTGYTDNGAFWSTINLIETDGF